MATATTTNYVEQIGENAGRVWHQLNENGPTSLSKLIKQIDAPRDVVMQAIGWLAREGKIEISDSNRGRIVGLR